MIHNTLFKKNLLIFLIVFLAVLFLPKISWAATYYINSASGNNANDGLSVNTAWATIGKANSALLAGDTVFVEPGTYNEAISPANSGSSGNYITYVAKTGTRPVIRQVILINKDYIRVIGFEITHNSVVFNNAVALYSVDRCEILDNYIHHTYGQGIRNNAYYGSSNYNIIRGNIISYTGCPSGVSGQCVGQNGINIQGGHNLFEYNDISHSLDFIDTFGGYNIIRNNYLHNFRNSDFPDGGGDAAHVDTWQPFGVAGEISDWNIFESNWASDNLEANSHFNQVRDESQTGEKEFIIRGNVALRFGSYIAQFGAIDFVRMYNNTFSDFFHIYADSAKGWNAIGFNAEHTTDVSTNNHVFNNIFYRAARPITTNLIYAQTGSEFSASNNACEQSGSHTSCLVTSGINFSNYAGDNFYLQSSSNAINAGKAITTITSASGNGNSFSVADANFFTDGFGITIGDRIKVNNSSITITAISGDMITVDSPISWTNGDGVYWRNQDANADIGAFEHDSNGYSYGINISSPLNNATVSGIINITANVSQSDKIRQVIFYIDGVPVSTDTQSPFSYDWNTSGLNGLHQVEAKAYPLYADTVLSRSSSVNLTVGESTSDTAPPSAPTGVTII